MIGSSLRYAVAVLGSFLTSWGLSVLVGAPIDAAILAVVVSSTLGVPSPEPMKRRVARSVGALVVLALLGAALHARVLPGPVFFGALAGLAVSATVISALRPGGRMASQVLLRSIGAVLFFPAPLAAHLHPWPGVVLVSVVVAMAWSLIASLGPRQEQAVPEATASWTMTGLRALQQGVGMVLTLVLGYWLVPGEVPWAFMTAYLVSVSVRTRAELVVKSLLRLAGALGGAVVGLALVPWVSTWGPWLGAAMLAVLIAASALRTKSYAWWSGAVTLLLTLLYGLWDPATVPVAARLGGIALGAACAIAAAFVVTPLRSRRVLHGLLQRALAGLDTLLAALADGPRDDAIRAAGEFQAHRSAFQKAFRAGALHRIPPRWHPAADWSLLVEALAPHVEPLVAAEPPRQECGLVRKRLGILRKILAGRDVDPVPGETPTDAALVPLAARIEEAIRRELGRTRPLRARGGPD